MEYVALISSWSSRLRGSRLGVGGRKLGVSLKACRAQRISVATFGGLPCISRPTLKIFAANQRATQAPPSPTSTRQPHLPGGRRRVGRHPRHHGHGVHRRDEADRTLSVEFGALPIIGDIDVRHQEQQHHRPHQRLRFLDLIHRRANRDHQRAEHQIGNQEEHQEVPRSASDR